MDDKKNKNLPPAGAIGGQAVIEGVMMRGKGMYAIAVRNVATKEINIEEKHFTPISEKHKFLSLPIIRGVVSFVDSLATGMKIITKSAEMSGMDELEDGEQEEPSKFEMWLENKFGDKLMDYIIYFSVFIAIVISITLFMVLPTWISSIINDHLNMPGNALGILEGLMRIIIFLGYIFLTAQFKDVKRVFMYHGAEHKTINCLESGDKLTVENVRKHTRLHKRCGTSFLLIVMIVSMIVFLFLPTKVVLWRILSRILFVPIIAGLSYEIIRWAGRHENILVKIVSAPGLCLQLVTTKEPDDSMIEVAIKSVETVLEKQDK